MIQEDGNLSLPQFTPSVILPLKKHCFFLKDGRKVGRYIRKNKVKETGKKEARKGEHDRKRERESE